MCTPGNTAANGEGFGSIGAGHLDNQEAQVGFFGGSWPFFPYFGANRIEMPGKKKQKRQKDKRRKVEEEKKEREEKEKKRKEKRPKHKIVPWEEKVENEKKEKGKEKEREGHPTFVALMEEWLLRSMPSDYVSVHPKALPPRFSAYRQADRMKIRLFQGRDPRRHGGTPVFLNTTIPLSPLCFHASHTAPCWQQRKPLHC